MTSTVVQGTQHKINPCSVSSFSLAMEKSKRVSLGVQKKNKSTTKKKSVLDYLKSDTYMFAPLISHSPSGMKLKENKKKRVLKMVGDYMKSDTYMYSTLLSTNLMPPPPQEKIQCIRKVTVEATTTTLNTESANAIANKQPFGLSIADNQTTGHIETVKHMVYQRYCSTPVSGKATADVQPRKLVVE